MHSSMLEKCSYFDDINKEYIFDSLTGVLNRNTIMEYVNYLIKNETPFSFAICDIDNFKSINDTYGHMIGDEVLHYFAKKLVSTVGDKAIMGRYGGDEFIIIYEGITDYKEVWELCHLINKQLSDLEIASIPGLTVTITTGVSRFPADGQTYGELFNTADKALYRGKTKGRNCFIVYMAEKHADIVHEKKQETVYNTVDMHARIFMILSKKGQSLYNNVRYMLKFLSNSLKIDHICIQDMEGITHSIVNPLSIVKKFEYIPSNLFIELANINGVFYVNQRKYLLKNNHLELFELVKAQELKSIMTCVISSGGKKYGLLRFDSASQSRMWQPYEMDLLVTAANVIGLILDLTNQSIRDIKKEKKEID